MISAPSPPSILSLPLISFPYPTTNIPTASPTLLDIDLFEAFDGALGGYAQILEVFYAAEKVAFAGEHLILRFGKGVAQPSDVGLDILHGVGEQ